jgi:hypothetical protein
MFIYIQKMYRIEEAGVFPVGVSKPHTKNGRHQPLLGASSSSKWRSAPKMSLLGLDREAAVYVQAFAAKDCRTVCSL